MLRSLLEYGFVFSSRHASETDIAIIFWQRIHEFQPSLLPVVGENNVLKIFRVKFSIGDVTKLPSVYSL